MSATLRFKRASSGIKVPLLGGDGWDSAKARRDRAASRSTDRTIRIIIRIRIPNPRVQEFIKKYKERFDSDIPDGLAALGYDAARIVCEAIGKARIGEGRRYRRRAGQNQGLRLA